MAPYFLITLDVCCHHNLQPMENEFYLESLAEKKKKMGDICEGDLLPVIYMLFSIDYSLYAVI